MGRRITTAHFVLLIYARPADQSKSPARLGVTVSRRVGNAVVRNRAKRVIRESFRATRQLWAPDVDLVVIVRHMPGGLGPAQVVGEWQSAEKAIRRRTAEARKDRERRQSKLAQRQ
jgi:ribonuclease P protein component